MANDPQQPAPGAANYQGAKTNAQTANDMKITAWADAACAIPLGALSRAGSLYIVRAALTACPVPGLAMMEPAR